MINYITNSIIWTLALFGLFQLIKMIIYYFTYTNLKTDGLYVIVATKNQENKIEGFLRSILFRIIYGKEEPLKTIMVTDLGSNDSTMQILRKLENDCGYIKVTDWKECRELLDEIESK